MVHKHKGVLTSQDKLRAHNVERKHSSPSVKRHHNNSLKGKEKKSFWQQVTVLIVKPNVEKKKPVAVGGLRKLFGKRPTPKVPEQEAKKSFVMCHVDAEGYININLDKTGKKGLRILFTRDEGRHKRTVPLQIENKASTRSGKGKLDTNLTR